VLGDAVDDATMEAWRVAYQLLADLFISVEKNLYKEAAAVEGGWEGIVTNNKRNKRKIK
jgi:nitric oxide dioxygenase